MISKNSKTNNSILSEMVSIMESKEHKQMFEPIAKTAQDRTFKEETISGSPSTPVTESPFASSFPGSFEDAANENLAQDTDNSIFQPQIGDVNLSMSNPQTKSVNAPGTVQDKTDSLKPGIAPSQLGEAPIKPGQFSVPGPVPSTAPSTAAVLEVLVKIANYLGEKNLLQSEAVADMLIETVLSETK